MPITFVLLPIAFLAVWSTASSAQVRSPAWWQLLLVASGVTALYEGLMGWQGVPLAAALWGASHQWNGAHSRRARIAWASTAIVLAAALATHLMPGFTAYLVAENVRLSPASAPMTLNADFDKASTENERNALWIQSPRGDLLCVQIAGLIARRILCYVRTGDPLVRGQRYGFIRFGSRVDVYLPTDARAEVSIGQKVTGGRTILARW